MNEFGSNENATRLPQEDWEFLLACKERIAAGEDGRYVAGNTNLTVIPVELNGEPYSLVSHIDVDPEHPDQATLNNLYIVSHENDLRIVRDPDTSAKGAWQRQWEIEAVFGGDIPTDVETLTLHGLLLKAHKAEDDVVIAELERRFDEPSYQPQEGAYEAVAKATGTLVRLWFPFLR